LACSPGASSAPAWWMRETNGRVCAHRNILPIFLRITQITYTFSGSQAVKFPYSNDYGNYPMGSRIPLQVEDIDQVVPTTSRKVFIAVDENGLRIGETHPRAKLTDVQVDEMRDLREMKGWTYDQLAEHFSVPYITVQKICTYERRASTIARWKVLLLHFPISITNTAED
jgi:hypothetical protein